MVFSQPHSSPPASNRPTSQKHPKKATVPPSMVSPSSKKSMIQKKRTPLNQAVGTSSNSPSTHVVRVNVLGLAGITVDRVKCKDTGKRKEMPPPPQDMKVVVAFSRSQQIRGTTTVSKPLRRSPNEEIVLVENGSEEVQAKVRSRACDNQSSSQQRHVAVWTSDDEQTLGSMVAFEANLRSSGKGKGSVTAASTVFTPMSFEVTAALTSSADTAESKVALPFGVANLNITGNECQNGETIVLDLPILSTQQANPLAANKDGLGGCQMIAIRPRDSKSSADRKRGLKRLFGRGNGATKPPKVPSIAERKAFSNAYSTDPSGDCVLRVQLQVLEKGVASKFKKAVAVSKSAAPGLEPRVAAEASNASKSESSIVTPATEQLDSSDQPETDQSISSSDFSCFSSDAGDSSTMYTNDSFFTDGSMTLGTGGTGTVQTDGSETLLTDGSETLLTEDTSLQTLTIEESSTFATPQANNSDEAKEGKKPGKAEDDYTLSFEPHAATSRFRPRIVDDDDLAIIKVFGHKLRLPTCGPIVTMKNGHVAKFLNDDITHVTGDFFGEDIPIPICSAIKPREDDETQTLRMIDTFSTMSEKGFGNRIKQEMLRTYRLAQKAQNEEVLDPRLWIAHDSENDNRSVDAGTVEDTLDGTFDGTDYGSLMSTLDGTLGATVDDTINGTVEALGMEVVEGQALVASPSVFTSNHSHEQEPIKPVARGSPKGVTDFELDQAAESGTLKSNSSNPTISQRLVDMFRCESSSRVNDDIQLYKVGVPTMIIPNDLDSIGDLTANSLERKRIPNRVKKPSNVVKAALLPVAFGGNGCSGVELVEKLEKKGEYVNGTKLSSRASVSPKAPDENYFHEYDDYSFRALPSRENQGIRASMEEDEKGTIELVLPDGTHESIVGAVKEHMEMLLQASPPSRRGSRDAAPPKRFPSRGQSDAPANPGAHSVPQDMPRNTSASVSSPQRLINNRSSVPEQELVWV